MDLLEDVFIHEKLTLVSGLTHSQFLCNHKAGKTFLPYHWPSKLSSVEQLGCWGCCGCTLPGLRLVLPYFWVCLLQQCHFKSGLILTTNLVLKLTKSGGHSEEDDEEMFLGSEELEESELESSE